jgi:Ca2+-binding RTX toxin-like protein
MTTQRSADLPSAGADPSHFTGLRRWSSGLAVMALVSGWMLAGATPASATTGVAVVNGVVTVRAVPGKSNFIEVVSWMWAPDVMIVEVWDGWDAVSAGAGCSKVESGRIWCGVSSKTKVLIQSGDMYDVIMLRGALVDARVEAGEGDDWVSGSPQRDDIDLGPGNDFVMAMEGADTVDGGDGNDTLHGNDGNDRMFGGDGNDVFGGGAGDEKMEGGAGDDEFYAHGGDDIVFGGSGADLIVGHEGNDLLHGDEGDDQISLVDGVPFNDMAFGGAGADSCTGDAGDMATDCESFIEQ